VLLRLVAGDSAIARYCSFSCVFSQVSPCADMYFISSSHCVISGHPASRVSSGCSLPAYSGIFFELRSILLRMTGTRISPPPTPYPADSPIAACAPPSYLATQLGRSLMSHNESDNRLFPPGPRLVLILTISTTSPISRLASISLPPHQWYRRLACGLAPTIATFCLGHIAGIVLGSPGQ